MEENICCHTKEIWFVVKMSTSCYLCVGHMNILPLEHKTWISRIFSQNKCVSMRNKKNFYLHTEWEWENTRTTNKLEEINMMWIDEKTIDIYLININDTPTI